VRKYRRTSMQIGLKTPQSEQIESERKVQCTPQSVASLGPGLVCLRPPGIDNNKNNNNNTVLMFLTLCVLS
jgi:hypothetical protein